MPFPNVMFERKVEIANRRLVLRQGGIGNAQYPVRELRGQHALGHVQVLLDRDTLRPSHLSNLLCSTTMASSVMVCQDIAA
jgi:hypothetical protein